MDGLLLVDKPHSLSSHDVVARARRLLGEKRIGHAGTLDPMATGVLVLCVGQATRLSEYLLGEDKVYEGTIKLGERTNTDDAEGEVIATRAVPPISDDDLRRLEAEFSGEIMQVPPQFSAIQKGGRRAYAMARKGEVVALEARRVIVHSLTLVRGQWAMGGEPNSPQVSLLMAHIRCGSGTYIRSLARDIGEALGCGGHLVALRRTQSGHFTLDDTVTLEQLDAASRAGIARASLLPMDRAVADWPEVVLDDEQAKRLRNGQSIISSSPPTPWPLGGPLALFQMERASVRVRVYDSRRTFFAVARWDGMTLVPVKVFDFDAAPPLV